MFVALGIRHAMRMRRIFICSLSGFTIFFPHLINGRISEEVVEQEMCVSIFYTRLSEIFLILVTTERDIINVYWCSSTYPLFLADINEIWIFSTFCRLRWSRGSVLAFNTQVRGFKPGRSLRIFRASERQHLLICICIES